jgi:hypothetical protein
MFREPDLLTTELGQRQIRHGELKITDGLRVPGTRLDARVFSGHRAFPPNSLVNKHYR